ncbi:hypothetical protein DAI22_05g252950 [Oryza sativa Japonica Group]|nr:hypothetical protein DAI22_05g252950 [Oryza sativa Japonica Group]
MKLPLAQVHNRTHDTQLFNCSCLGNMCSSSSFPEYFFSYFFQENMRESCVILDKQIYFIYSELNQADTCYPSFN